MLKKLFIVTLSVMFVLSSDAWARVTLKLAHNLTKDHPTSVALKRFADNVRAQTNGEVRIRLFLSGVLGNEREVLEQVQNGVIEMTRVSASNLESFSSFFTAFTLPYLFDDKEHYYSVLSGPIGEMIYEQIMDQGFYGLTFFDGGVRSFYTVGKPILKPDDLRGQKIRVMNSHTAIRMIELMGGTPTPLPYGDIYTAMQQRVIDGAENNPTALTIGRHGEVAKYYSFDEHTMIPEFLIISVKAWEKLKPEHQRILKEAAREATNFHIDLWNNTIEEAIKEAEENMNVKFYHPEKDLFREKVAPLYEEYRKDPKIDQLITSVKEASP